MKITFDDGSVLEGLAAEQHIRVQAKKISETAKPETKPQVTFEQLVESFMRTGLPRAGAEAAARGRQGSFMPIREMAAKPAADEAAMERYFRNQGLSEAGVKAAVRGRVA